MLKFLIANAFVGLAVALPQPGQEEVRIVGGENIDITEAPYQVALLYGGGFRCGGTIIANNLIVTATHCFLEGSNSNDYQIRAGSSFNDNGGELHSVEEFIIHPDFNHTKLNNDIAILYLMTSLNFSNEIAPIDMMEKHEEIEDGVDTIATGWGNTREGGGTPPMLQKVLIPKVNQEVCSDAYKPFSITPNMLCAGEPTGGKGTCQGDSGGPLVYNNKLAGVVSCGVGCARPNYPGIFAKVSALRDWLDENIAYLKLKRILREF